MVQNGNNDKKGVLTKFIVDAMLGNIAKKLRLLGYDTLYHSTIKDDKVLEIAKKEKRTIITRDKRLAQTAKKDGVTAICISLQSEEDQLVKIAKETGIDKTDMDIEMTRCSICNTILVFLPKEQAASRQDIPKGVFENEDSFWLCESCNKAYWAGSHFDRIREYFTRLNNKIRQRNSKSHDYDDGNDYAAQQA